jgi:hypothetical protein
MSAALAASSIALKSSYPVESANYLEHAQKLFSFAILNLGTYSDSVRATYDFYRLVL